MNSLAKSEELATDIGETTEISWHAPADMTYDQWEAVGRTLQQVGRSLNWWIGDWLNEGETRYGEMYAQALEITGLSVETLTKYKATSARIPPEMRRTDLSWTSHFSVAYTREDLRGPMLEMGATFKLASRDLKDTMKLSHNAQRRLVAAFENNELQAARDFHAKVNELRLSEPDEEKPVINGHHLSKQYDSAVATIDHERDEEEQAEERPTSNMAPGGLLAASGEPEVYLEEVIELFSTGIQMEVCKYDEAVWEGLFVIAAIDKKGRPYLHWGKPGGDKR